VLAPDQRKVLGSNPSAPKFVPIRDGATGSTSGFEPEDEGSTPSAGAILSMHGYFDGSSMVNLMFIRLVSGEIDVDSHVSAGLFCAASS
jgi:hypothetical protein